MKGKCSMIIDGRNIPDLVQNSVDRLIKGCNEDDILVDCYMSELQALLYSWRYVQR